MSKIENTTMFVKKRNGDKVAFDSAKISAAIRKAANEYSSVTSNSVSESAITKATETTICLLEEYMEGSEENDTVDIEVVQDAVERALAETIDFELAKTYVLYRARREEYREKLSNVMVDYDGELKPIDYKNVTKLISSASDLGNGVDKQKIERALVDKFADSLYDGIEASKVLETLEMAARELVIHEPNFQYVAARVLLERVNEEIVEALGVDFRTDVSAYLRQYLETGVAQEILDKRLLELFDLDAISKVLSDPSNDATKKMTYLSMSTVKDRYLIRNRARNIIEHPVMFFMRVAMGQSVLEQNPTDNAIGLFNVYSNFNFMSSTPTLFNSGTVRPQLSSCYLTTVPDSLSGIFDSYKEDAMLSKYAGGIANDWTRVRAMGASIKGTNGVSEGIIPFIKLVNDTAVAVNQCFSPDAPILTNEGYKPASAINTGDFVVGSDTRFHRVNNVMSYTVDKSEDWRKIHTNWHPALKVTGGHPLTRYSGNDIAKDVKKKTASVEWVDANKLSHGDWVAMPVPISTNIRDQLADETRDIYGILVNAFEIDEMDGWIRITYPATRVNKYDTEVAYLKLLGVEHELTLDKENKVFTLKAPSAPLRIGTPYALLVKEGMEGVMRFVVRNCRSKPLKFLRSILRHTMTNVRNDKDTVTAYTRNQAVSKLLRELLLFAGTPSMAVGTVLTIARSNWVAEALGTFKRKPTTWHCDGHYIYTMVTANMAVPKEEISWTKMYDFKVEGDPSYTAGPVIAHNGGKRRGAICCYLEPWHADFKDFIELKKVTGEERRRAHDINTASWVSDLFMKRVINDEKWSFFSPDETPELHETYGKEFERIYEEYERKGERGELNTYRTDSAKMLWRKMLTMLYQTGHPWICWKDPSNIRYPNNHRGIVRSSNLCTEIIEHTSDKETAVCNLGSINASAFVKPGVSVSPDKAISRQEAMELFDQDELKKTVSVAVRALDNVIDINYYPVEKARYSNMEHRPIGLGIMGFQDVLYKLSVPFESENMLTVADVLTECISYYAIEASCHIASAKGAYPQFEGSLWSKGALPIHSLRNSIEERGEEWCEINTDTTFDWDELAERVKRIGIRNGNIMAIAPTATISNICGVSQSIEPTYMHLYTKSNLSGEFTHVNQHMVDLLKAKGKWNHSVAKRIELNDGKATGIPDLTDHEKEVMKTSFEIDMKWVVLAAARRQKWIDQSASTNLYFVAPTGKQLSDVYALAWKAGLKTTYYLRALAETSTNDEALEANEQVESEVSSPDTESQHSAMVCSILDGDCQSCQ